MTISIVNGTKLSQPFREPFMRISRSFLSPLAHLAVLSVLAVVPSASAGRCPNVHILLDRSGSTSTSGPMGTRAQAADEVVKRIVDKLGSQLPLGMSIFPGGGCDLLTTIPPSASSAMDIRRALTTSPPAGGSAIGSAVKATALLPSLRDPTRVQYQILVTDGSPACSATLDTQAGAEAELMSALRASPSITTYVIGLDAAASTSDINSLNGLAIAGGKPSAMTAKYYPANSTATAQAAVDAIIADLLPIGGCDDSCYATGCTRLTDLCILGTCRPNPCAGVTCPTNQYCYTDGVSPGACVKACTARCSMGSRCRAGACIASPCGDYCPAGTVCNSGSRMCQPDPLCTGVMCKGTSKCSAGLCIEDPCTFITCPSSTRCVPWEGSCEFDAGTPADMGGGMPADMGGGMPSDMGGGMPADMGGGMPADMSGGMPADMSGGMPADMSGCTPSDLSGVSVDLSTPLSPPPDDQLSPSGCSTAPGSSHATSLFVLATLASAFALLRRRPPAS